MILWLGKYNRYLYFNSLILGANFLKILILRRKYKIIWVFLMNKEIKSFRDWKANLFPSFLKISSIRKYFNWKKTWMKFGKMQHFLIKFTNCKWNIKKYLDFKYELLINYQNKYLWFFWCDFVWSTLGGF